MRQIFAGLLMVVLPSLATAQDLPIFDAHIHYSHDAVELLPPAEAAAILRKAGIKYALVSSSDDTGTQLLFEAAPDIVIPALRPYRRRGEISSWMHDPSVIDYVEANLKQNTYYALGEFHGQGGDMQTPVIQRMIELAKEYDLLLHAHVDIEAIDLIFKTDPGARVLWAHSGFEDPAAIADLLRRHVNLWSDLAFRSDQAPGGTVDARWHDLFMEFPTRFVLGTDTFTPSRWFSIGDNAAFSRAWLAGLPSDLAANIAYKNALNMLGLAEK